MGKFNITIPDRFDPRKELRRLDREEKVDAMRDGVRQRAHTFKPKRGKGSYTRRKKHRNEEDA